MNCEYCGTVLADGETECPSCGAKVTISDGKKLCVERKTPVSGNTAGGENARIRRCSGAQCRTPIPDGSSVCPKCGLAYNETIDRALCAAETPIAPGIMYAIAGIMVVFNAILFAVSEFLFPEICGFTYIAGIVVPALLLAVFSTGSFGFRRQPKVVRLVFYAAFGIAALISCVNFCWNSVLMSKYSLYCALRKSGKYKFAPSFQWRKGVGVVSGNSKIRELYRLRSGYRYWYFAYNSSNMQWVEGFSKVDPDLALNWIRASNKSHCLLSNFKQQKVNHNFETSLKENKVLYLFFDEKQHEVHARWYPLAKFKKNPEFVIDRIRKNYLIDFGESDKTVVFE